MQNAIPPPQVWLPFNLNDYVRVKLTPRGREIYMEDFEKYGIEKGPPPEDADGWCEMQCWCLMQIFGAHICMGIDPPFNTQIEFQRA